MEPLLHFVLPLVSLLLLGEKPKTAAIVATLGVLPDMDAVLLVHRSISHSIIVWALLFAPLYIFSRLRRPNLERIILLGFLVVASHPILDLGGLTPILWPISMNSIRLGISLNGVVDEGIGLKPHLEINQVPTNFIKYTSIDYPLFTYDGLLTAVILLLPVVYQQIRVMRVLHMHRN